jgi:phosphoserine aminotransferase
MTTVSTTSAATRAKRAFNFNAGPAALPLPVLERIREELLDYRGTGMSVMELSHRSAEFEAINNAAEQNLRMLLAIPEEYAMIFVQGGGSMQFTMVPMNLCLPGKPVDVLHTGAWTAKAIGELKKGIPHHIAASTEAEKFVRVPRAEEIKLSDDASYTYFCTNNTIEGTQYHHMPASHAPLVADMSSDIASRPIDVSKFGLIFAGAQKNLGPSGVTVVIVRKDLAERADKNLPTLLQYRTHIKEKSLYHTPPTFAVYILSLQRLLPLPGGEGVAFADECGVSRGRQRRGARRRSGGKGIRQAGHRGGIDRHARASLGRRNAHLAIQRCRTGRGAGAGGIYAGVSARTRVRWCPYEHLHHRDVSAFCGHGRAVYWLRAGVGRVGVAA